MSQLRSTDLKRLHRSWRRSSEVRIAVMLEQLQGPFNVGAITRTSAAFGADELLLIGNSIPPDNAKAQKTAMGTDRYLKVSAFETIADGAKYAREAGYHLLGLELASEARPLHALELARDVCIVVGHEDRGLSADALSLCDSVGFIPQLGKVGSLNVATAAAIATYEIRRQDWSSKGEPSPNSDEGE
ncbi:TrmH family RNA methyltransferase [Pseudonocardiaceae bacterium YIM PH 21723]|nr:TrmH family RNA methyltransferase [Pseudonocardiaceae bacterium YIM PH 21723]